MRMLAILFVVLALAIAGCRTMDYLSGLHNMPGVPSPLESGARVGTTMIPPPYSELALTLIIAVQNAYLFFRRQQLKKQAAA